MILIELPSQVPILLGTHDGTVIIIVTVALLRRPRKQVFFFAMLGSLCMYAFYLSVDQQTGELLSPARNVYSNHTFFKLPPSTFVYFPTHMIHSSSCVCCYLQAVLRTVTRATVWRHATLSAVSLGTGSRSKPNGANVSSYWPAKRPRQGRRTVVTSWEGGPLEGNVKLARAEGRCWGYGDVGNQVRF